MRATCLVLLLGGALAVRSAVAQVPGSLDTNYVTTPGSDSFPTVLVPAADGRLQVGGSFTNYGGTGRGAFARLLPGGALDTAFTVPKAWVITPPLIIGGQVLLPGSTNSGSVSAALLLLDGRPVIAGAFTHLGTTPAPGVAVLNTDGSVAAVPTGLSKIEPGALLPGPGNTFYVGGKGNFEDTRLPLLRFNPDGSRDLGFTPPTLASLGYLSASAGTLLRGPGDAFYVVTAAALAGFVQGGDIVRLTSTGALDASFADAGRAAIPLPNFSTFASSLSGQVTFTGVTTYRGAALPRKVNRLTLAGDLDSTFNATVDPGFGGRVVGVQADGKVLYTSNPIQINRLNADGSLDTGYANPAKVPVAQTLLSLTAFALAPDQSLYAGGMTLGPGFAILNGAFHIFGDPNSAPSIAIQPLAQTNTLGARTRFSVIAQGAAPLSYQWFRGNTPMAGATAADLVLNPTTASDDADYHCVVSNSQGAKPSDTVHLTLLPAVAGTVYRETDVPTGPNRIVNELAFDAAGGLLAAGEFTTWNQTNRSGVVRLLPGTAEVDPAFVPVAPSDFVNHGYLSVLPLPGGRVLGSSSVDYTVNGQRYGVMRFNANGSQDASYLPQTGYCALAGGFLASRPAVGPDGKVVFWASYWNNENMQGSHIRLNADGSRDTTFTLRGSAYGLNGYAVAALPDGRYLVAGGASSQSCGLVRLNANGTVDPTFKTASRYTSSDITDILVQPDGRILLAGTFRYRANTPSPELYLGLARVLPNGGDDPEFNPVPQLSHGGELGFGGLRRLALQADGWIVATTVPAPGTAFPRNGVARFWPNGTLDPDFQVATNSTRNGNFAVTSLAVRPDNTIFLGGAFTEFARFARTNFVRLNGGPLQPTPAPPTIASQPVKVVAKAGTNVTLTITPGGDGPFQFQWRRNEVQASTNFVDIVGATNASLTLANLRLVPQDSGLFQCSVVNPGGAVHSALITLLVEPDPALAGMPDTSLRAPEFQGILTGQYQISDVAPDGAVYGSLGNTLVRLFEDGTRDLSFNPPTDLVPQGGGISIVKRQPDGKLLVAGRLKDGALARLLPDGSYDPGFVRTYNYTGGFQDVPHDLGLQSDGGILLAGTFSNFAGRAVHGLVRFHADGSLDESFPLTQLVNLNAFSQSLPGRVFALRVLTDDSFYIGGDFNRVNGVTRHGIARLQANGALDTGFVSPTNASASSGTAGTMLFYQLGPVSPAGGIYLFGQFRPDPSKPGDTALRLQSDGSVDPTFHLLTDFQINTGAVQPDGKLIINGQFGTVNGQAWGNLARVNLDGSLDASWQKGSGGGAGVGAQLQLLPDGKLLAGSQRFFTGAGPIAPPTELGFTLKPGGLELSWPAGYKLQRTVSLSPADWQDVLANSPLTVPPIGPGAFFRLIQTP